LNQESKPTSEKSKSSKHWILWALVVIFVVGSITAMMLADYYFAPESASGVAIPKDAADK